MGLICTPYGYSGAAEVSGLLIYQQVVLNDKPVAYWPLNETGGTVANDLSGNGYNAAYQNAPTLGAAAVAPGLNKSVSLNGNSQYVELATVPTALQIVKGSFEAWIKLTSAPNGAGVFASEYSSGSSVNFALAFGSSLGASSGSYPFAGTYNKSAWEGAIGSTAPSTNSPYHIVGTFDGSTYKLYVNGVLITSSAASGTTPNSNPIVMGRSWYISGANSYLAAYISNFAIYNTALTAAQILNHYNAGIA